MQPGQVAVVDDLTEPLNGTEVRIVKVLPDNHRLAPYTVLCEADNIDGGIYFAPASLRVTR